MLRPYVTCLNFLLKEYLTWFMVVMSISQCIYIASAYGDVSKYFRTGRETKHNQSINYTASYCQELSLIYIASCCQELSSHLSYCPLPKVWSLQTIWDIHRNIKICVEDSTNAITKVQYYKFISQNFCAML